MAKTFSKKQIYKPYYDPEKDYYENFQDGPYGGFANSETVKNEGEPKYEVLGHKVYLPFGIPAGPLINSNFVKAAFKKGFDVCIYKTVRTNEYPCHQLPNVLAVHVEGNLTLEKSKNRLEADTNYSHPLSITNSFGVPSYDPDFWQDDMVKANKAAGKGQLMIGSFQGTNDGTGRDAFIKDYVLGAKLVKETGIPAMIANLSCPNEGTSDLLCFDTNTVVKISELIKNEIGNTPLLLKLAYFKDDNHLQNLIEKVGNIVDGFAAINTIPADIVDINGKQALPGEGRLRSGVCGATIKWAGLEMTSKLVALRKKLNMNYLVIGVGGVTVPEDYTKYRDLGADVVLSATGSMWNPYLAQEIKELQ